MRVGALPQYHNPHRPLLHARTMCVFIRIPSLSYFHCIRISIAYFDRRSIVWRILLRAATAVVSFVCAACVAAAPLGGVGATAGGEILMSQSISERRLLFPDSRAFVLRSAQRRTHHRTPTAHTAQVLKDCGDDVKIANRQLETMYDPSCGRVGALSLSAVCGAQGVQHWPAVDRGVSRALRPRPVRRLEGDGRSDRQSGISHGTCVCVRPCVRVCARFALTTSSPTNSTHAPPPRSLAVPWRRCASCGVRWRCARIQLDAR